MMLVVLDPGPGARPILGTHYDARGVQKGGPHPGGVAVLVLECRRDTLADQAISDELCLHQVEGREAFDEIRERFRELHVVLFLAGFHPYVVPRVIDRTGLIRADKIRVLLPAVRCPTLPADIQGVLDFGTALHADPHGRRLRFGISRRRFVGLIHLLAQTQQ
jgi:hypothetical protein